MSYRKCVDGSLMQYLYMYKLAHVFFFICLYWLWWEKKIKKKLRARCLFGQTVLWQSPGLYLKIKKLRHSVQSMKIIFRHFQIVFFSNIEVVLLDYLYCSTIIYCSSNFAMQNFSLLISLFYSKYWIHFGLCLLFCINFFIDIALLL